MYSGGGGSLYRYVNMWVYLFDYMLFCFIFVIMDTGLIKFMEQELGSCKDIDSFYNIVLPKIDGIEGKVIIYGTGGYINSNYIGGIDPYKDRGYDSSLVSVGLIVRYEDGTWSDIKYFKSNKNGK